MLARGGPLWQEPHRPPVPSRPILFAPGMLP